MQKCIICDEEKNELFSKASETSLNAIQSFSRRWAILGTKNDICGRVKHLTYNQTTQYHYHRKCYMSLCHQANLVKAKKKYEGGISNNRKRGRPSQSPGPSSSKTRKTFDSALCVFCQISDRGKAFQVRSDSMGSKFLQIKEFSKDANVRARLALLCAPRDAFAKDIKYHTNCLRVETKNVESCTVSNDQSEFDATGKAICDIEIVNIVRAAIKDNEGYPGIDMNSINSAYLALLNEYNIETRYTNYKQYLKSLLVMEIPELQFVKHGPKPDIVFSKADKDRLLANVYVNTNPDEEMKVLSKASQIIRKEIENVAQHIISSYRSKRQVMYEAKIESGFQKDKKTPWNVGLALTSYQANRSRSDVETLYNVKAATTYDEVE
ncbi:uncharacterized protein LOC117115271 [Anneissia japonica]|uniref:uncharacterized protein LOC117115271 n=1 Tax=Anneissia japonica TaxID=1529436 RepID=UPI001425543E|nr:uncharacterized protein LOC117115271 [Anneissia japonica]